MMDYNQRIRLITAQINDFLRLYKRPDHLDQETALAEMREMAEEINLLIPSASSQGDLEEQIRRAFRNIRQSYKGRSWPTVSHIVDAMNVAAKVAKAKPIESKVDAGWLPDTMQIMADRMRAGGTVGEGYLYGRSAVELINAGMVDRETLQSYRTGLYMAAKDVYGEEVANSMQDNWIKRHDHTERLYG
jgi:hypothetical protein